MRKEILQEEKVCIIKSKTSLTFLLGAPGALGECEPHEPGSLVSHVLRHDFEVTETDPSITEERGMSCNVTRH